VKLVFTDEALRDLDRTFEFNQAHYPAGADAFQRRLRAIEQRIARWLESAPKVKQRPGVRVAFPTPHPFKLFYRIVPDTIEVLHVAMRRAMNHGIVRRPEKLRQTANGNLCRATYNESCR
jgi:plasmid stabilization system protein ParE